MNAFALARQEHLRLSVLLLLEKTGSESSRSILLAGIRQLGHRPVSFADELDWLAEHGLIRLTEVQGVPTVALTERGHAVSSGHDRVTGVARRLPNDW